MHRIAFCLALIMFVIGSVVSADSAPKTKKQLLQQGWVNNSHEYTPREAHNYGRVGSRDELVCNFRPKCTSQERVRTKDGDEVCVDYSTCRYRAVEIDKGTVPEIMAVDEPMTERPTADQLLDGMQVSCLIDPFTVHMGEFYGVENDGDAVFMNDYREVYNCRIKKGSDCASRVRQGKDFFRCIDPTLCAQNFRTTIEPRTNCRR